MSEAVLDGVRIVEVADGIAGPVATMLLAAAGADVVKVEPPGGAADRGTPGFATWNRTKRSVVLDLSDPDGLAQLHELLATADVLVHGFTPATAAGLGLDDRSLLAAHPALVVCGVTGFPIGHPDAELPASDPLVLARAGLMDEQLAVNRPGPTYLRMPLGSWGAVYLAAAGVLAKLLARSGTGRGGAAHTSLLQGALLTMTMHWARASEPSPSFALGMPKDTRQTPLLRPSLFECGDGVWIHVMSPVDHVPLMAEVLAELGDAGIAAARERWGEGNPNYPNFGANCEAFLRYDSRRWLDELWANDIAVQPAVPLGAVFSDEQAIANGYVLDIDDPDYGKVRQAGIPFTTSPPSTIVRPAPRLGEHTAEVLAERRARPEPPVADVPSRWPLEGLKVLDFGMFLAGPIAPMMLADLGADVIKVEQPSGDLMRFIERTFSGCQRGKRTIAVDFKNPESREVLQALVGWADVVHHNLRLPAARKLGLDAASLRAMNPRLVYCHVSSYGPTGHRADWPGFDQLFQAASGWEYEGAGDGNPPMWHRFGMMDHQGGSASLVATLLALLWRERTGEGQAVAASLLGASVLTISETMVLPDGSLADYARLDHDQLGIGPGQRIVEVADGWIALDARSTGQLAALCDVAGVTEPEDVPKALADRRRDEVVAALSVAGVPATTVALDNMHRFFDDPSTWRARLGARYPHPSWGMVEQVGSLWDLGDQGARLDRSSPTIGQHTVEILTELGFDDARIRSLLDAGAIADRPPG